MDRQRFLGRLMLSHQETVFERPAIITLTMMFGLQGPAAARIEHPSDVNGHLDLSVTMTDGAARGECSTRGRVETKEGEAKRRAASGLAGVDIAIDRHFKPASFEESGLKTAAPPPWPAFAW